MNVHHVIALDPALLRLAVVALVLGWVAVIARFLAAFRSPPNH